MMAWCADVVLLPLAHTHAGPQPCAVASLNSYKRPRDTTLSIGDRTALTPTSVCRLPVDMQGGDMREGL